MTPGNAVRALLGPQLARVVGRRYRAAFVDLAEVARSLCAAIPRGARILDVGGGDGEPLNYLLGLRRDIVVTTIDVAEKVGHWIEPEFSDRVTRFPRTSVHDYLAGGHPSPDVVLINDVLHHVPADTRSDFVAALMSVFDRRSAATLIVKDVEPGHLRATLGYWSDRYVTGDKTVKPISQAELRALVQAINERFVCDETRLFAADAPNYALVFTRPQGAPFPGGRRPTAIVRAA